jgi:hypothetical protein
MTRKFHHSNDLFLYGCRGYSYNIFTENIEDKESKEHVIKHLIKAKQPTKNEGKIKCLKYDIEYKKLRNNEDLISSKPSKSLLIQIFKKNVDIPRLSFILKNNRIIVSWSKEKCNLKQKFSTIKNGTQKHKIMKNNIKSIKVSNVYDKLKELIQNPTYELLKKLFGFNKSYLSKTNDIESLYDAYRNANIYVYSIV